MERINCCDNLRKVAVVEVYEGKNQVQAYGFMAGDRSTPQMEVRFKHLFGEVSLEHCKLRYVIVDDVGSLIVGEVGISSRNEAIINLPNQLFVGERRMKVQLTLASCDGQKILNLQQFTDLKVINNLTPEIAQPVYDVLINKIYDLTQESIKLITDGIASLNSAYAKSKASLEQYLVDAQNGGNAAFLEGYRASNFNRIENTVSELAASTKYKLGDIVEVLGDYSSGDGAGHKRKIESADDGSGVRLANGLWGNVVQNSHGVNKNDIYNLEKTKSNKKYFEKDMTQIPSKTLGDKNSDCLLFIKNDIEFSTVLQKTEDRFLEYVLYKNLIGKNESDAGQIIQSGEFHRITGVYDVERVFSFINKPNFGNYSIFKTREDNFTPVSVGAGGRVWFNDFAANTVTKYESGKGVFIYSTTSTIGFKTLYNVKLGNKINFVVWETSLSCNSFAVKVNGETVGTYSNMAETGSAPKIKIVEIPLVNNSQQFSTLNELVVTFESLDGKPLYIIGLNLCPLDKSLDYTGGFDTIILNYQNRSKLLSEGANDYAFYSKKYNRWFGSYHGAEKEISNPTVHFGLGYSVYSDITNKNDFQNFDTLNNNFILTKNIYLEQKTKIIDINDGLTSLAGIESCTYWNTNGTYGFQFNFKSNELDGWETNDKGFMYCMTTSNNKNTTGQLAQGVVDFKYLKQTTDLNFSELEDGSTFNLDTSYGYIRQSTGAYNGYNIVTRFDSYTKDNFDNALTKIWSNPNSYRKVYASFINTKIKYMTVKTEKDFFSW